jgi:membrane protein implicated in regulation of membrane protease activity
MRVFVDYLIFVTICLLFVLLLQKDSPARSLLASRLGTSVFLGVHLDVFFAGLGFACISGVWVFLLMQLKSFIFNIYHVVMTSIKWELYQKYNENAEKDKAN